MRPIFYARTNSSGDRSRHVDDIAVPADDEGRANLVLIGVILGSPHSLAARRVRVLLGCRLRSSDASAFSEARPGELSGAEPWMGGARSKNRKLKLKKSLDLWVYNRTTFRGNPPEAVSERSRQNADTTAAQAVQAYRDRHTPSGNLRDRGARSLPKIVYGRSGQECFG